MVIVLSGQDVATSINKEAADQCKKLKKAGKTPVLQIIRIGDRNDDLLYEQSLQKICQQIGIVCNTKALAADSGQKALEKEIRAAVANDTVHGILLFSPLPKGYDLKAAAALIPPEKDIDCLNPLSSGRIFTGDDAYPPATAEAVIAMLDYYQADLQGKNVTVIGRSLVVGKPLAMLLLAKDATVTIAHSRSEGLPAVCRKADVVIAATGRAKMFKGNFFTPGQVAIDVGINDDPDNPGKICGDIDYETAEQIVAAITPVPGGIGSITSAILCAHVVDACAKCGKKN